MIHFQQASNAPIVHPIHIHLHPLLTHLIWVASLLGLRRITPLALLAPIALTSALRQSRFNLTSAGLTIGACIHFPTLLHLHSFHDSQNQQTADTHLNLAYD